MAKQEQVQHKSASSKARRLARANGSEERIGNMPSNNEEQNKSVTSNHIKEKENGMDEDNAWQQSVEKSDQPMSELAGSQGEATEMT